MIHADMILAAALDTASAFVTSSEEVKAPGLIATSMAHELSSGWLPLL